MKPTILFVDDEPNVLSGMRRSLLEKSAEWSLHFVGGGAEALETLLVEPVDVIVTDHNMPGMTGLQLLGHLKGNPGWAPLPVIVLTGMTESELKRQALEAGAFDLLHKPTDREDLVARVQSALRVRDLQRQMASQGAELQEALFQRTTALKRSRERVLQTLATLAASTSAGRLRLAEPLAETAILVARASGMPVEDVDLLGQVALLLAAMANCDPAARETCLGPAGFGTLLTGLPPYLDEVEDPFWTVADATMRSVFGAGMDPGASPGVGVLAVAFAFVEARVVSGLSVDHAVASVRERAGERFDPAIVDALASVSGSLDRVASVAA